MSKKSRPRKVAWNKGKAQGQKRHFTLDETVRLSSYLGRRRAWHDLALLSVALDSLLRASDLLRLTVADVSYSNGHIRQVLHLKQQKTANPVQPVLTTTTRERLAKWIVFSGKEKHHFLFTRRKPNRAKAITHKHLVSLIKDWAIWLGHPPEEFAAHSLRRSKAVALYRAGAPIAELSEALGHKSEASTLRYLGVTHERVRNTMLSLDMTKGFSEDLPWE